jgi:hypothetical protein
MTVHAVTVLRAALAALAMIAVAAPARADWLLTPFAGATTGTQTTYFDLDAAAGRTHATYGAGLTLRGDGIFGIDVEASWTPAILTGDDLVESSRAITALASVVLALPARWARVARPYVSIGVGVVSAHSVDVAAIFPVDAATGAGSVSAGVWIPLARRFGARASVRYLRTGSDGPRTSFETWQTVLGLTMTF